MFLRTLFAATAVAALAGCTISAELAHTSHPLRGEPFGPAYEEDTLDTIGLVARKEYGRVYVEHGLAYKWRDGGVYGDDFVYSGRIGVRLFGKD